MKHIKLFEEWLTDKSQPFLFEGGAAGHMAHPFDDKDLTFGDFKAMVDAGQDLTIKRLDHFVLCKQRWQLFGPAFCFVWPV
jgi:hypothetical protein